MHVFKCDKEDHDRMNWKYFGIVVLMSQLESERQWSDPKH